MPGLKKEDSDNATMNLILWRHAEAEDGGPDLADARRRLTPKGEKQARQMARWLEARLAKKPRVLVSPSQRTQQTAHALAIPFEIDPRVGVGANADDLIAAAGWPEAGGTVVIVGHQPTLGRLAARLLADAETDWTFKKGAIWWLSSRVRDGRRQTVLQAAIGPDLA